MAGSLGCGELPDWAKDRLITVTTVHLGWLDRIRVLVQGELTIRSAVTVEHAPGRHETASAVEFRHWCWPGCRHMALGTVTPEDQP